MRLYDIEATDIEKIMASPDKGPGKEDDRNVVYGILGSRFGGLPLKVIYVVEGDNLIVVSAYPLKKSYWR